MSRIGKQLITIPEKTTVAVAGRVVTVKGPLGELTRELHPYITATVADGKVNITPARGGNDANVLWGTSSAHVVNMIEGVNKLFQKKLIVEGIGFKSEVKGDKLLMALGYSHPVELLIPKTLKVTADKNIITVSGVDKDLVGQFAAKARSKKVPEPYKGKGIRYEDEVIRRKQGKKTA